MGARLVATVAVWFVVGMVLSLARLPSADAEPLFACSPYRPCPDSRDEALVCELAVDDPTNGVCVGQTCAATADCPSGLVCGSDGRCTRCAAGYVPYGSVPCSPTCDNRSPVCAAVVRPGCACPSDLPIQLPNGSCGASFAACASPDGNNPGGGGSGSGSAPPSSASASRCPKSRRACRRKKNCSWDAATKQCVSALP